MSTVRTFIKELGTARRLILSVAVPAALVLALSAADMKANFRSDGEMSTWTPRGLATYPLFWSVVVVLTAASLWVLWPSPVRAGADAEADQRIALAGSRRS